MKTKTKTSVTLKINKTSVMLYRNEYLKATNGLPGMTAQRYVASFSTRESVMPNQFHAVLRELTSGDPERFGELTRRIEDKVLLPRHAQLRAMEDLRNRANAVAGLDTAIDGLRHFESAWRNCESEADSVVLSKLAELSLAVANVKLLVKAEGPGVPTLGISMGEMLRATTAVRDMLAVAPNGKDLALTPAQVSDWRMTFFAFSQARDYAGHHNVIAAKRNWATDAWADEAIMRGFATEDKVLKARAQVKSLAKAPSVVERIG